MCTHLLCFWFPLPVIDLCLQRARVPRASTEVANTSELLALRCKAGPWEEGLDLWSCRDRADEASSRHFAFEAKQGRSAVCSCRWMYGSCEVPKSCSWRFTVFGGPEGDRELFGQSSSEGAACWSARSSARRPAWPCASRRWTPRAGTCSTRRSGGPNPRYSCLLWKSLDDPRLYRSGFRNSSKIW